MNGTLGDFAKANYPDSKSDLFAMFMERTLRMAVKHGMMAMINMQSWMFLSSFEKLRGKLLSNATLLSMAHLGERGFDTIGGAVVSTTAFVFGNAHHASFKGGYARLIDGMNEAEKAAKMKEAIENPDCGWFYRASAEDFEKIPGSPIAYWLSASLRKTFSTNQKLSDCFMPKQGMATGDNETFLRYWPEINFSDANFHAGSSNAFWESGKRFCPYNKGGKYRKWFGNREYLLKFSPRDYSILKKQGNHCPSENLYFKECVTWSDITTVAFGARFSPVGSVFDVKGSSGFVAEASLGGILSLFNSKVSYEFMRILNPTSTFQVGDISKIPVTNSVDMTEQNSEALVSISKSDWDGYETSWDFTTLPLLSPDHRAETLEATYARLRTNWQSMTDEMQRLEEENNRIFIDAYGLQDELTPEVPIEEITLTCNPAYRYGVKGSEADRETRLLADTMAEFLSYAVGCMFGRYSLDEPGLILANQGETLEDYLARGSEPSFVPDEDNVIPVLDSDWFPDDITERFRLFLRKTFGDPHFQENLKFIEDALGKDIRKYFTKDFYTDHVKRYKKRPIYWMVSSPKGTFNALIYMHRYRGDTMSVVLNEYLREFISKLEAERTRLEKLSDDPTATQGQRTKALKDANKVAQQLDELTEWERDVIFPLAQQKIEIDLDDGVKANYPKFGSALKKIAGLS